MPQIDKPLAELREYRGINPRPGRLRRVLGRRARRDARDGLARGAAPREISGAVSGMFRFVFHGRGRQPHSRKYLRPKHAAEPHPAILQFHGYSGDSGEWSEQARYVARGFFRCGDGLPRPGRISEDLGGVRGTRSRARSFAGSTTRRRSSPSGRFFSIRAARENRRRFRRGQMPRAWARWAARRAAH